MYIHTETLETTCVTWLTCVWHLKIPDPYVLHIYMYTYLQIYRHAKNHVCDMAGMCVASKNTRTMRVKYIHVYKYTDTLQTMWVAWLTYMWHLLLICV